MNSPLPKFQDSALGETVWRTAVPIRFSHCDPAGIVYFARYFDIINGVIEDWFCQELQIDYHEVIGARRVGLGYVNANAEFAKPGLMGDKLDFAVVVRDIGRSSFRIRIHASRGSEPVLLAELVVVTTSLETHRSILLPDDIRAALELYQEKCQ